MSGTEPPLDPALPPAPPVPPTPPELLPALGSAGPPPLLVLPEAPVEPPALLAPPPPLLVPGRPPLWGPEPPVLSAPDEPVLPAVELPPIALELPPWLGGVVPAPPVAPALPAVVPLPPENDSAPADEEPPVVAFDGPLPPLDERGADASELEQAEAMRQAAKNAPLEAKSRRMPTHRFAQCCQIATSRFAFAFEHSGIFQWPWVSGRR
jgi:hypothetical protein